VKWKKVGSFRQQKGRRERYRRNTGQKVTYKVTYWPKRKGNVIAQWTEKNIKSPGCKDPPGKCQLAKKRYGRELAQKTGGLLRSSKVADTETTCGM